MGLGRAIIYLVQLLAKLRPILSRSASRIFMFWRGGIWTYIGISSILVLDLREPILTFLQTLDPVPLFQTIGMEIATSWHRFLDGVVALSDAGGWETVNILGFGVPTPEVVAAVFMVVLPLVYIGWYFRTIHLVISAQFGEMIPWSLSFMVGLLFFPVLVWGATGSLPAQRTVRVFSMGVNGTGS